MGSGVPNGRRRRGRRPRRPRGAPRYPAAGRRPCGRTRRPCRRAQVGAPRVVIADLARRRRGFQAAACAQSGRRCTARILDAVVADVAAGRRRADLLAAHGDDPFGSALPLRFLGAVHRIVLEGRAPELAAHYPSAGGTPGPDARARPSWPPWPSTPTRSWPAHRRRRADQRGRAGRRCWSAATLEVARARACRCGCSRSAPAPGSTCAGTTTATTRATRPSATPTSPVRFDEPWDGAAARPRADRRGRRAARAATATRSTPPTDDGRLTLRSFVWPDQLERFARLDAAIEVARRVPATVDRADARDVGRRAAGRARARRWPPSSSTRSCSSTSRPRGARQRCWPRSARPAAGRPPPTPRSPGCAWSPARDGPSSASPRWPGGDERRAGARRLPRPARSLAGPPTVGSRRQAVGAGATRWRATAPRSRSCRGTARRREPMR